MTPTTPETIPALQPPGAGLPKIELIIARTMVRWQAWRSSRAGTAARFERERVAVLALARSCDPQMGCRPVLIKRLAGMEDSSRHWSVYMTLDHLRIVNLGVADLIRKLGRGQTPGRVTGTADVKPSSGVDESVVAEFERSCEHLERCVAGVGDLRTPLRWPHPWFGPKDAADWYFIAAFHLGLHRQQIETILRTMQAA